MTRAHYARTAAKLKSLPYEYAIFDFEPNTIWVRKRGHNSSYRRWGSFDTPRQALNAYILLMNPSEDEGKSMILP